MKNNLNFSNVKLVAFDFDGVFTDNKVYVDQDGNEMICCWRSDGIGLRRLEKVGVKTIVITFESNSVVKKRCEKLKIDCITGCEDKLSALKEIMSRERLSPQDVCFVGNDTPDIGCLKYVGFPVVVKDGIGEALKVAKYITKQLGGMGAVREVCDLIYSEKRRLK